MTIGTSQLPMLSPANFSQGSIPQLPSAAANQDDRELRQTFDRFVGEAFYGQMLAAMRKTVGKPAYFHGGRGEEVFQQHLDHVLAEEMTKRSGSDLTDSMYQLFQLGRK